MISSRLAGLLCLSLTLAAAPVYSGLVERAGLGSSVAYAKNGGDKGGNDKGSSDKGGGGAGHGSDKSSGKSDKSKASHANAGRSGSTGKDPVGNALDKLFGNGKKIKPVSSETRTVSKRNNVRVDSVKLAAKPKEPALSSKLAGLNSLNRNYHAYMNSSDPRLAALSAFVTAYAEYELANGTEAPPADPALGDDALRAALLAAANPNRVQQYGEDAYVDGAVMAWAKDVLGVGPSVGKIDQVREALAAEPPPQDGPEDIVIVAQ